MKFRPDIQILRAIAVLSVILNHSKFSFKSGELGVDIFFVISGYLITGLLVNGNVKLGYFYAKRAKRILPSAMAVIFLTLIASLGNYGGLARRISVEAIKTGQSVQFSVADNGSGVPQAFQSQLFELLSTTKQTGMGLGLWLCKHIVTRCSGSIHYEDVVGGGARFIVKFPPR